MVEEEEKKKKEEECPRYVDAMVLIVAMQSSLGQVVSDPYPTYRRRSCGYRDIYGGFGAWVRGAQRYFERIHGRRLHCSVDVVGGLAPRSPLATDY